MYSMNKKVIDKTEKDSMHSPEALELLFSQSVLCSSKYDPNTGEAGRDTVYSRWYATDFIDVSAYCGIKYELAAHKYLISAAFYDAENNYLGGIGTTSSCMYTVVSGICKLPRGTKYAKFITFNGLHGCDSFDAPAVYGFSGEQELEAELGRLEYPTLKIACLGDSLTEGDYGSYVVGHGCRHYRNFPYYLQRELGCETLNYGKCGYTAAKYLEFFNTPGNVDVSDADLILIMLGTNGGLTVGSTAQKEAYLALIDAVSAKMKQDARIVLVTPPHTTEKSEKVSFGNAAKVLNAVETVREIAAAQSLPLIDAYTGSPIQSDKEEVYQPYDGLHMAETGYRVFAGYMADELRKLIGQ